jgi:hypothetical protein
MCVSVTIRETLFHNLLLNSNLTIIQLRKLNYYVQFMTLHVKKINKLTKTLTIINF